MTQILTADRDPFVQCQQSYNARSLDGSTAYYYPDTGLDSKSSWIRNGSNMADVVGVFMLCDTCMLAVKQCKSGLENRDVHIVECVSKA
jgi:hypothetical protein